MSQSTFAYDKESFVLCLITNVLFKKCCTAQVKGRTLVQGFFFFFLGYAIKTRVSITRQSVS